MPNYLNGKIYTIRSYKTDEVYVGSTTQPLSVRMSKHRTGYKLFMNGTSNYVSSFEILKFGDAYIELVILNPCNSKTELDAVEGNYIREMDCINKNIPGRTSKQYRIDNKDEIKQYKKQYYIENKDKINEYQSKYQSKYYTENRERLIEYQSKYNIQNKDRLKKYKKQYQIENKEKIKESDKQYRIKNKERLTEKHKCKCGGKYTTNGKSHHLKTKKHKLFITMEKMKQKPKTKITDYYKPSVNSSSILVL